MKKNYMKPAMQAQSMTMTCMVCASATSVGGNTNVSYGGKSSNNTGGVVRSKDRGWGDGWGDNDCGDWEE